MKLGKEEQNIFASLDLHGIVENKTFDKIINLDFSQTQFNWKKQRKLRFKNVNFKGDFTFTNFKSLHLQKIEFEECTFHNDTFFKDVRVSNLFFGIKNCVFNPNFSQLFSDFDISIFQLEKSEFGSCNIDRFNTSDLLIYDCSVVENLCLRNVECHHAEIINNEKKVFNHIVIKSPKMIEVLIDTRYPIDSLRLWELQTAFISGVFNNININAISFKTIEISSFSRENNQLITSRVKNITFREENFDGILNIENLEIENLIFAGLNMTNGSVRFNEITIIDATIYDCTISNFYWNQVKFINPPEIMRSDLSALKMSNVFWKNDKRLKNSFLDQKIPLFYSLRKNSKKKSGIAFIDISNLKYQRDTYRQLKAASIANHNHIEALGFYKNEMRLYWKEIRLEGGEKWYDRILIFINRWVSNFGQSWHVPLFWLTGFHLLFFSCLIDWSYFSNNLNGSDELGQYFYLLNPVHKTPDYVNTGWGNVTEFFMRVLSSFFIYHFIRATRKFGKV